MTKVLLAAQLAALLAIFLIGHTLFASTTSDPAPDVSKPGEALYLQLGQIGLDPHRVYHVRNASLERPAIHITLEDGTLAFTQDVMGRITGAFFEGDGEVLLEPPNDVERRSLSAFTGMAILEERFATAYLRFNDDTGKELQPDLRRADDAAEFYSHWNDTARNLAQADAMRLMMDFSRGLPAANSANLPLSANVAEASQPAGRMLHARLQGVTLGIFDVFYDSTAGEPVEVGQARVVENGDVYYDVWASFSPVEHTTRKRSDDESVVQSEAASRNDDPIEVEHYSISTEVTPPRQIHSEAVIQIAMKRGGQRTLLFELSRLLQVERVEMNGKNVEFIHNPAVEGTQLSRRGNDLVALVLPDLAKAGDRLELKFVYGGEVLAEAGGGLLYVGEHGTWYPNRGFAMANFDLEFHYPQGWTLVATGKPVTPAATSNPGSQEQVSRWVSDRPIPVAGFNLGKYKTAKTKADGIIVEAYAATGLERAFPAARAQVMSNPASTPSLKQPQGPPLLSPLPISPASNEGRVAAAAAQAIEYYSARFGPFPYSRLSLTQMPGRDSQGWPGLIFLSSYAFLNDDERAQLRLDSLRILLQEQLPAHETAHQWWGDLVTWNTYRDQWFSEGLANYCSLMMLQEKNPAGFHQIMEKYRQDLLATTRDGLVVKDDGPVTLGTRLWSSRFPQGYEAISYGRGTWLFHMLRTMLRDAAHEDEKAAGKNKPRSGEEPFIRALRKVRERYQGKALSTNEMFGVFAEELPPSLRYEGKASLQWFVEGWVNGTSIPKLGLKSVKIVPKENRAMVSGVIVQKEAPDDLVTSVPVYAVAANRTPILLGRVFADGEESSFRLSAPEGTRKILLDPNETILTNPK